MTGAVELRFGTRTASLRPGDRGSIGRADRLAGLDLLRLLAALAVVLFHFGYAGPVRGAMQASYPEIAGLAKYGFVGVDLFFVISGFVIAASVDGRTWGQFAVSRLLRLYPAHVICMTATAIVLAVLGTATVGGLAPVTWAQWLANLTVVAPAFGQPFMDGAYWSIVLEIVFYGWVAVMMAAGLFQRRLLTVLAIWLAIAFINEALFQWRPLRMGLVTEYAGMFASGILIHRIRGGDRSLPAFALLGFAVGLGALHAFETQRALARIYAETFDLSVLWGLHAGIYAAFAAGLWLSRRLPASPFVLALGGLTYPLYLLHQRAGHVLIDRLTPGAGRWAGLAIVVAGLVLVSWLIHRSLEPAGRRLLRTSIDRLMQHAARRFGPRMPPGALLPLRAGGRARRAAG